MRDFSECWSTLASTASRCSVGRSELSNVNLCPLPQCRVPSLRTTVQLRQSSLYTLLSTAHAVPCRPRLSREGRRTATTTLPSRSRAGSGAGQTALDCTPRRVGRRMRDSRDRQMARRGGKPVAARRTVLSRRRGLLSRSVADTARGASRDILFKCCRAALTALATTGPS